MEQYYTVKEVAELLEVSQYRIKKLIHNGWLRAERGPRRMFLISMTALFDYAYHGEKYRKLLRAKIGIPFIIYSELHDAALLIRASKQYDYYKKMQDALTREEA